MKTKTLVQHIIDWTHTTEVRQLPVTMLGEWMYELLVFEKQQLKKAYTDGRIDALTPIEKRIHKTAEHYYKTTFEHEL